MAKRLKIKVEVEFECPASCEPEEAFSTYFRKSKNVENKTTKLLSYSKFTTPGKINARARAHNEARRILQTILSQMPVATSIKRGYRSNWNGGASTFEVHCDTAQSTNVFPNRSWFTIRGATFEYNDRKINLADPAATAQAAQFIVCTFGMCSHKDKAKHV